MPWGNKSEDHDTSGLSKKDKQTYNTTVARINQGAKVLLQRNRKATNKDGNGQDR